MCCLYVCNVMLQVDIFDNNVFAMRAWMKQGFFFLPDKNFMCVPHKCCVRGRVHAKEVYETQKHVLSTEVNQNNNTCVRNKYVIFEKNVVYV